MRVYLRQRFRLGTCVLAGLGDVQDGDTGGDRRINQPWLGDERLGPGIFQHEPQPGRRVARVQREIGASSTQHTEQRHNQGGITVQAHTDHIPGPGRLAEQRPGQPVGAAHQLGIGQALPRTHHSDRLGTHRRPRRHPRRNRE